MIFDNRPYTFDRVVRLGMGLAVVIVLILLLGYLSNVLVPFAVAFLLAYLFNPIVILFQRIGVRNRLAAVLLTLLVVTSVITIGCYIVIPMIVNEVHNLILMIKDLLANKDLAKKATEYIPAQFWSEFKAFINTANFQEYLTSERLLDSLRGLSEKVLPIGKGIISTAVSIILGVVGLTVVFLYLIFLMLDFQQVRRKWKTLIPPQYRDTVISFVREFDYNMNRYFRAQATIAALVGIVFAIGFGIIGLPLGVLLGLFIGLLNMVPYLQTIGLVPAVTLAFAKSLDSGESFWFIMAQVLVVFIVAQAIQDLLLTPRIMGDVTGLSPAIMILSLSIWGKLLGVLGLLVALPMTCLLLAYYKRFILDAGGGISEGGDDLYDDELSEDVVVAKESAGTGRDCANVSDARLAETQKMPPLDSDEAGDAEPEKA